MGHVERAEISGFKCVSAADLECGQFNVLTGRNGTGKSSILEAIQLAHDPTALEAFDPAVGQLIEIGESTASVELMRSDERLQFSIERTDLDTAFSLVSESIITKGYFISESGELVNTKNSQEFRIRSKEIINDFEQHLKDSGVDPTDLVIDISYNKNKYTFVSQGSTVWDKIHDFYRFSTEKDKNMMFKINYPSSEEFFVGGVPNSTPIRIIKPTSTTGRLAKTDSELHRVRVRDFLREYGILTQLKSFSFDELVFDEDDEQYAIPYDFLGEGTKTITSLVWQLLSEEEIPDVILLEEPENHLHPGYVKELVEFLIEFAREENVQLFVTTHNVDFLREFFNDATIGDHEAWLAEEFRLIQTTELSPKQFDYERAKEHVEELQLDLRGL